VQCTVHPPVQRTVHPDVHLAEHPTELWGDGNLLLLYNITLAIDSGDETISILPDSKKLFSAAGLEKLYFSMLLFSGLRESAKLIFTRKPKILENIKTAKTGKFITFFIFFSPPFSFVFGFVLRKLGILIPIKFIRHFYKYNVK